MKCRIGIGFFERRRDFDLLEKIARFTLQNIIKVLIFKYLTVLEIIELLKNTTNRYI